MNLGQKFETKIGGRKVEVEIGKYAMLTSGSCFVKCEGTVVMVNVAASKKPREGIDYFPLTVDYEEKMYSVGRIPGGFKKREGRAADKAILTARLIDRPIRPLFPKGFRNDVGLVATVLSVNPEVAPEPLAMFGSSIALSISNIPFDGPTGSVNVGLIDNKYVINPSPEQLNESLIDLTVSGTKDAILMVEAGAKEVTEKQMLDGILAAHKAIKDQVKFQNKIVKQLGIKKQTKFEEPVTPKEIEKQVTEYADEKLDSLLQEYNKLTREQKEQEFESKLFEHFEGAFDIENAKKHVANVLYSLKKEKVRNKILTEGIRPDGRKTTEVRPIWCETGILPRVHGSAVFTRGLTQALTALTLGPISDVQMLDGLDDETQKRYMHHYNFPSYSVGETRPSRGPGRREIGHGSLAERALLPVLPTEEEFPYAIRTVSEILSSNGSTSQASVCGSTLSLMDGGVPIKSPVAGIAMGLIKDTKSKKVSVLTDIQGLEDFLGDMDFKVAGTKNGITAIQMDIKIKGIEEKIFVEALEQARIGRLHILGKMIEVLDKPKAELSEYAPKITTFNIDPEKIRDVIGTGGKVINKIIADTGVKIDISEEGSIFIATQDAEMAKKAKNIILSITEDLEAGKKYKGTVIKVLDFGAFVQIAPGKEGMIHISKLSKDRVEKVTDVVNVNDEVEVEVIKIDNRGRVDLKLINKL
jgi:polyribonucleotide nucleotidyltransferase